MKSNDINAELDDEGIWQQIIRESEDFQNRVLTEYLSESVLVEIRKFRSKRELVRPPSQ